MPYLMGAPFLGFRSPEGSLSGLSWRLPFLADYLPTVKVTPKGTESSTIMGGPPGQIYDVTLRFRGVVEQRTYTGGTNDGAYWQVGGSAPQPPSGTDRWNVYKLEITPPPGSSNPVQTYYLNRGTSFQLICYAIDYTKTIQIEAGSTVLLWASSSDDDWTAPPANPADLGYSIYHAISVAAVTDPAQPYNGQWINMEVVSIVPQ